MKLKIDHELFIVTWQQSADVGEVLRKLQAAGITCTRAEAAQKARVLRMEGVPLKRMPRGPNWPYLQDLARRALNKEAA